MGGKEEIGPTPTSTGEQNQNKWTQIIFLITLIDSKAWRTSESDLVIVTWKYFLYYKQTRTFLHHSTGSAPSASDSL